VLTSLKHFPGHGSSKDDTHLGIADVTNTWEERELKPYKSLIDSGYVDAVMTSHIVNRKLDKQGNPGTLSADILDGILRKQLKFNGVIFTDDMQMHAITKHYGLEEAIKLAINGGVDIMTFSNNIQGSDERTVDKVHTIIKALVMNGQIKRERIEESYKRISKLKGQLTQGDLANYFQQALEKSNVELMEAKKIIQSSNLEKEALIQEKERLIKEKLIAESEAQKKPKKKRRNKG
jgi:beta-N-acetylhexosaminidase